MQKEKEVTEDARPATMFSGTSVESVSNETEEGEVDVKTQRKKNKREDSVSPKVNKKTRNSDADESQDEEHIVEEEEVVMVEENREITTVPPDIQNVNASNSTTRNDDASRQEEKSNSGVSEESPQSLCKIFVGTLPKDLEDKELRQLFEPYGEVEEAIVLKNMVGISKCCGFIRYRREEDAAKAIKTMNNKKVRENERPIQVRFAEVEPKDSWKLFVGSIPSDFQEEQLKEIFAPFGELKEVVLLRHPDGTSRNAGFVRYTHKNDAKRAMTSLNEIYRPANAKVPLVVRFAEPHKLMKQMMNMNMWTPFMTSTGTTSMVPTVMDPTNMAAAMSMNVRPKVMPRGNMSRVARGNYADTAAVTMMGTMPRPHMSNMAGYPVDYATAMGLLQATGGYGYGAPTVYSPMVGQLPYGGGPPAVRPGNFVTTKSTAWPEGPEGSNLFAYNLPFTCTETDLYTLFAPFGNIITTKIVLDKATQLPKGMGYIAFDNPASAQFAMQQMNGYLVQGKALKVVPKRPRPGSSGGISY